MTEAKKKKRKKPRRSRTRSSFAWAREHRTVERIRPAALSGPVEYLPPGLPGQYDKVPVLSVKVDENYLLLRKRPKGKKLYPTKNLPTFTRCCSGHDHGGKYCHRKGCINCYTKDHTPPKGFEWVIQSAGLDDDTWRVIDPHGIDPRGKRPQGKDMDADAKDMYRLTSSLHRYKGKDQRHR
jgi:hypothetical protein